MPKAEEKKVKASARKAGLKPGSDRYEAYVWGTMNKIKEARKRKRAREKK